MTVFMTDHSPPVEVITPSQGRRRWSAAEKMRMVAETYQPDASASLGAQNSGVGPNQMFAWRRLAPQGALTAAATGLQQQVRELQLLPDKKTLEVEILNAVLERSGPKKTLLLRSSWRGRDGSP